MVPFQANCTSTQILSGFTGNLPTMRLQQPLSTEEEPAVVHTKPFYTVLTDASVAVCKSLSRTIFLLLLLELGDTTKQCCNYFPKT